MGDNNWNHPPIPHPTPPSPVCRGCIWNDLLKAELLKVNEQEMSPLSGWIDILQHIFYVANPSEQVAVRHRCLNSLNKTDFTWSVTSTASIFIMFPPNLRPLRAADLAGPLKMTSGNETINSFFSSFSLLCSDRRGCWDALMLVFALIFGDM